VIGDLFNSEGIAMSLKVLRVVAEGTVTSFRYPHFLQGVQPTYELPPPATLYGHICSALGELVAPESFRMAIHFEHGGKFIDYEHTHMFGRKGENKLSPTRRELLFRPCLTLYVDRPEWQDAFRHPRFALTLGRSQDLMSYREVKVITLQSAAAGYLEHTLIPLDSAVRPPSLVALTMPRYLTPDRVVIWGQYAMIRTRRRVNAGQDPLWIDPEAPFWQNLGRGVIWL
jgi:CRISPR-associated protein Cas5t